MAGSGQRRPTVDDLRTAFYRQAPTDRVWIREVHLDPLELVVSDDRDGTIARVPVTVSASGEISFGEPVRVRMEYVPADTSKVDASKLVYASAADSRAGHGTRVYATITSRKGSGAMPQQELFRPLGPPRRPGEDAISWALRTGRIGKDREQYWRGEIAASARITTDFLERLHPGCAVPLTSAGVLDTVAAAGSPRSVAAAAARTRPQGVPSHWFAANPLVDQMRQVQASVYADAIAHGGPVPTLFGSGDLPAMTTSGLDPAVLAAQPWPIRHPLAAAATAEEAEEIMADAADSGEHFTAGEWMQHDGNRDYQSRVTSWAMRAIESAGRHRQVAAAQAAWQSDQQVAAAVEGMTEEEREDLLFDDGPGRAHLEHLRSTAAGRAVGSGLTQTQARMQLERFASGQGPSGRYGRVSPAAAQVELAKLDKELGHTAAAQQVAAAAAEREGR